jgi:hypothetical protein
MVEEKWGGFKKKTIFEWSDGVLGYWSDGQDYQYLITPVLQLI